MATWSTLAGLFALWVASSAVMTDAQRYVYYYRQDLVMVGRCTCLDPAGTPVTFQICTPTRGNNYNQCLDCGSGNVMPRCQATARARGLTGTCTEYIAGGCVVDCNDGACRPDACYRGNC